MARDADEVARSQIATIGDVDGTIDVAKGPVYESSILPWSKEVSSTEGKVEHLGELYQLEKASSWSQSEITVAGRNFGQEFGRGTPSQGFLLFYANEAPTTDVILAEGTLAATEDGVYVYKTVQEAVLYASNSSAYYNATTRRYEITIPAEAVQRGSEFDCKEGRITLLLTRLAGLNGVTNSTDFEGGSADQTKEEFAQDLRQLPLGNSLGTPGGIQALAIRLQGGEIQDSVVVTPGDIGVFERGHAVGMRVALDFYVIGSRFSPTTYSYTTSALETTIIPDNQPILAVSSVLVNGVPVTYTFSPDTHPARRGSPYAQDAIVLDVAPGSGADVFVTYTYNTLISQLHDLVNDDALDLFRTSILVREGKKVACSVKFTVASYGAGTRRQDVENWVYSYFKDPTGITTRTRFVGELDPEDFREKIEKGLSIVIQSIDAFNRPDRAISEVQTIVFAKNEYPSPVNLTVVSSG
jgi:hypothetical protein